MSGPVATCGRPTLCTNRSNRPRRRSPDARLSVNVIKSGVVEPLEAGVDELIALAPHRRAPVRAATARRTEAAHRSVVEQVGYDRLIVATGAVPQRPAI